MRRYGGYIQGSHKICKKAIMKSFKTTLAALVCSAIASMALTTSAQQDKQGMVTVVRVEGIVTYSLGPNQPEHPLVAGKFLAPGSIIFTKDNGLADIVLGKSVDLPQAKWTPDRITPAPDSAVRGYITYRPAADQNSIRINPNSTLSIDKLTVGDTGADTVSDTELDLKQGKIFASVRKLSGASQYIVKLPNGVAGVRGTLFSLGADGSCDCYESTGGGVIIALDLGGSIGTQTFVIPPGQFFNPATGTISGLPPAVLQELGDVFKSLRTAYYALVSFEQDFTQCHVSPTTGKR
jgi:hypothetical protein